MKEVCGCAGTEGPTLQTKPPENRANSLNPEPQTKLAARLLEAFGDDGLTKA